jgi:hypothetical protein
MGLVGMLLSVVSRALLGMVATLFTQKFIKDLAVLLLEKLAKRTQDPTLHQIIENIEAAFNSMPADNTPPKL